MYNLSGVTELGAVEPGFPSFWVIGSSLFSVLTRGISSVPREGLCKHHTQVGQPQVPVCLGQPLCPAIMMGVPLFLLNGDLVRGMSYRHAMLSPPPRKSVQCRQTG